MLLAAASMSKARSRYQGLTGIEAWRSGVEVNQWKEITGTGLGNLSFSMAAPNGSGPQSGKMDSWNGLVIDDVGRVYSPWNGGHDDYWGNEVDVIDFRAGVPAWSRLEESSVSAAATTNQAYYSDGRPASCHSYGSLHYVAPDQRIIRAGSPAVSKSGFQHRECAGFDVANGVTLAAGTIQTFPNTISETGPVSFKDTSDNLYLFTAYSVYKYTRSTNTWDATAVATNPDQPGFQCSAALDTSRNRVLILGGHSVQNKHYLFTPPNTMTAVTITGDDAALAERLGPGLAYCPDIDRFLLRLNTSGGALYSIHPTTFAITAIATSGGDSIAATDQNAVYTRFLTLPSPMNGVIYYPRFSSNAWYFRTS